MSKSTNRFKENWQKKNTFGKVTDVLIIIFIITLFIPQSRLAIGGFVNRVKAMIISPSAIEEDNRETLSAKDYNWELINMSGDTVQLADYKDKVLFINLWATWCPPCVGEMPEIQDLWETFRDNPDVELFLITNEDLATVTEFLDKRDYTFPVYMSRYAPPEILKSQSIPTSYIISKNGEIVVRKTGAAKWGGEKTEKLIKELVNE
jgi:peroxiredoxin